MDDSLLKDLGPLAPLAGVWEGDKGADVAPSDDRRTEHNQYRERIRFEPMGAVNNHEQVLYGLRYSTVAWRLGEPAPFHEETGYWLWDPKDRQVLRCFLVPRGIAVIAGGTVAPDARRFTLAAVLGSPTYGICSNQFLDREFQTVRYDVTVTINDDGSFGYDEDTQLKLPARAEIFHHTDRNTLHRVSSS
jgi:hypothetical protein